MKKFILVTSLVLMFASASAQFDENFDAKNPSTIVKFGLGMGLDYGGFGTRLTITPTSHFGAFIAVGYNLEKMGINGGLTYKFLPENRVNPVLHVMYGYNAVIIIENADSYNKTYYGLSLGGGIELNSKKSNNYWSFEIICPFKSSEYQDDWDAIKNDPDIEIVSDPLPITFSIGYHFSI